MKNVLVKLQILLCLLLFISFSFAQNSNVIIEGNLSIEKNGYINFEDENAQNGYGIRDNNGILQYKNENGTWANIENTNNNGNANPLVVVNPNDAQDLINKANAGGTVFIPPGIYEIDSSLNLPNGTVLIGLGHLTTVIKQADNANLPHIIGHKGYVDNNTWTGSPVEVLNLRIDGNKTNNTATTQGILIFSWNSLFQNLKIDNCSGNGILISSENSIGQTITNTMVEGTIKDVRISNCDL